jgi:hypothetical protein
MQAANASRSTDDEALMIVDKYINDAERVSYVTFSHVLKPPRTSQHAEKLFSSIVHWMPPSHNGL